MSERTTLFSDMLGTRSDAVFPWWSYLADY